ncbi:hypothetical protein SeLEV6574_g01659 [Synchytrium endobioticum]|uniref:Uncharacterized protein n=1 Tax=Synchytrium endobioticum TaxID=286115 RepID=A0A507DE51_9FUNG|nr:hypothetical protein SeLEV6574_g01659 [Synchytrium endobioticum]
MKEKIVQGFVTKDLMCQLVARVELPEWRRTDSSPEDRLALKGKKEKLPERIQMIGQSLKLNRFLGLHLFLLQAISNRVRIVSENDVVPGVKPPKGFARAKVMEIWEHVHADDLNQAQLPAKEKGRRLRQLDQPWTYSNDQWKEKTGINLYHRLNQVRLLKHPHVQQLMADIPSACTSQYQDYIHRPQYLVRHLETLVDYHDKAKSSRWDRGYARAQGKSDHVLMAKRTRANRLASVLEDAGCFVAQRCQPLHAVRYCETCSTVWDRDYNAAKNILHCFLYEPAFSERPRLFKRV